MPSIKDTHHVACANLESKYTDTLECMHSCAFENAHDAGTLVAMHIDGHLSLRERLIIG